MRSLALALLGFVLPALATAAPEQLVPYGPAGSADAFIPTKLPLTYILDYNDADYFSGNYEQYYREGPPGLLHMGTVTPAHSYFGPAHDAAAAMGKQPQPPVEQFVQKYRARLAEAQRLNDQLRKQGVGKVVAYVCLMTTGGDPDKRTGFWHFYDNWEAFTPLGAGPKTADDPVLWQQRRPDGSEHHYYTKGHYLPLFYRYSNCVNNPCWQQYMRWVIRGAAEARFDGVFVDNASSEHCYCQYCRTGFEQHLRSRYTPGEIRELFGDDLSLATDGKGLRGAESAIFWGESIHRFLGMIREEGSKVRGSFFVFPNALQGRPLNLEGMVRDCDLGMYENSVGTYGTNPGRTRSHVIAGIFVSHINDNIFAHQVSAAAGAPCRSALLTRPGYPKADPAWRMNAPTAELGLAEAAAFSGGGCFLHDAPRVRPDLAPARTRYNAFLAGHKSWYEGAWPCGSVGVLTMLSAPLLGDRQHVTAAESALETLLAGQIPADPVVERELGTDLSRYPVLIVPPVASLPEAWLQKLTAYARAGGRLIISRHPATATLDQIGRLRDPAAVAAFCKLGTALPDDLAELSGRQGPLADYVLTDPAGAAALRAAVYADSPTRPRRLMLHLVNYDVMLGVQGGQIGTLTSLPLRLRLPGARKVRKVTLAVPGASDAPLAFRQAADRVTFSLPRLDIYAVCLVELEG